MRPGVAQHLGHDLRDVPQIDERRFAVVDGDVEAIAIADVIEVGVLEVLREETHAQARPRGGALREVLLDRVVWDEAVVARAGDRQEHHVVDPLFARHVDEGVQRLFHVGDRGRTEQEQPVTAARGGSPRRRIAEVEGDGLALLVGGLPHGGAQRYAGRAQRTHDLTPGVPRGPGHQRSHPLHLLGLDRLVIVC